jgi:uncharacterized protein (TIGR02594 family)
MMINPYEVAKNLIGLSEVPGPEDNYFILWCLSLCGLPKQLLRDETAWCSALINGCMRIAGIKGTNSAAARSWLRWGVAVAIEDLQEGDILIFSRGDLPQPGPEVLDAPAHVTFFTGNKVGEFLEGLGGNQDNKIGIGRFPISRLLGARRAE